MGVGCLRIGVLAEHDSGCLLFFGEISSLWKIFIHASL